MVSVMLICVRNMELTYELHKAIKLNFIDARNDAVVVCRVSKHFTLHHLLGHIVIVTSDLTEHYDTRLLHQAEHVTRHSRSPKATAWLSRCTSSGNEYDVTDREQYTDTKQVLTFRC